MKINKESSVSAVGKTNSKHVTIPIMVCELLQIEAGDKLLWTLDSSEEEPAIKVRVIKKEDE